MLLYNKKFTQLPIISLHTESPIATLAEPIINSDSLRIVAFFVSGLPTQGEKNIIRTNDIRDIRNVGIIIDSIDEIIPLDSMPKLHAVASRNYSPLNAKVQTIYKKKLGKVSEYTVSTENFYIQQLSVTPRGLRALSNTSRLIGRSQIKEVRDHDIIVDDTESSVTQSVSAREKYMRLLNEQKPQPSASSSYSSK